MARLNAMIEVRRIEADPGGNRRQREAIWVVPTARWHCWAQEDLFRQSRLPYFVWAVLLTRGRALLP